MSTVASAHRGGGSRGARTRASGHASTAAGEDGLDYTVAIIQGRGAGCEIGIAAISTATGRVVLTQISDDTSFRKSLHHLMICHPHTVLLPPTIKENELADAIEEEFGVVPMFTPRASWNRDEGLRMVQELSARDDQQASTLMTASDKYLALCALSALFKWLQETRGISFSRSSVSMRYEKPEDNVFIDADTVRNLELVSNHLSNKSANTLYGLLNVCYTPMGSRLLRSNIIHPFRTQQALENRLDTVQELMEDENLLDAVRQQLAQIAKIDFEGLLGKMMQEPKASESTNVFEQRVTHMLQLRAFITGVGRIGEVLVPATSPLLQSTGETLRGEGIQQLGRYIGGHLSDEAHLKRASKTQAARHIKLFAVRSEVLPLLGVARKTYTENDEDIRELLLILSDKNGVDAELEWTDTGYRFSALTSEIADLPNEFINVERGPKRTRFATNDLLKRNSRMMAAQQDIFSISNQVITRMMKEISAVIGVLHSCCDSLAVIDVLASFATVSQGRSCTRPIFGRTIAINEGRHPVLDKLLGSGVCIPNNVFASSGTSNFQIIQGPNMSGKSTYLRQIALLTVQATIGCFVPAEYASFIIPDAIVTRLSNDDSMERCLSTFASEMATSAMILGIATSRSLVLIDELGRGTSPAEGVGLSHAIAEELTRKKAFVFFATHFHDLSTTLSTQRGVVSMHLAVQHHDVEGEEFDTIFQYKVVSGPVKTTHYGLELAKLAALPDKVLTTAKRVAHRLSDMEDQGKMNDGAARIAARRLALLKLRERLVNLSQSRLPDSDLAKVMKGYQRECVDSLVKSM